MIIQISSGQGPVECEIFVEKLYKEIKKNCPDVSEISRHASRFSGYPTSIMFETEEDLSDLEGTIQWICQSPVRPTHKRKNWYVDVSIIPEEEVVCTIPDVRFEFFHCGGNGGQNVNKVETGVRAVHIPTGIATVSTEERSQLMNRKRALEKLNEKLAMMKQNARQEQIHLAWKAHTEIVRGNPVRVYKGENLIRV